MGFSPVWGKPPHPTLFANLRLQAPTNRLRCTRPLPTPHDSLWLLSARIPTLKWKEPQSLSKAPSFGLKEPSFSPRNVLVYTEFLESRSNAFPPIFFKAASSSWASDDGNVLGLLCPTWELRHLHLNAMSATKKQNFFILFHFRLM